MKHASSRPEHPAEIARCEQVPIGQSVRDARPFRALRCSERHGEYRLARLDYLFQPYSNFFEAASLVHLAGVPGFEPGLSVLETDVLTVDTIPLHLLPISKCRLPISVSLNWQSEIGNWQSLGFLMISVLATTATELTKLQ